MQSIADNFITKYTISTIKRNAVEDINNNYKLHTLRIAS